MEPSTAQTELPNATGHERCASFPPPNQLHRNLQAIAEVDPALAERLRRIDPHDHFEPVIGRDGRPTLKRKHPDGTTSWLGRSSMPTVSGPALLDSFDHTGGNIALHGFGQGQELALLLQRIEPRQTVFVLEPDLPAALGPMIMHDLSDAVRLRSMVLFAGDGPIQQLLAFLKDHPGFDPPGCFPMWPWQPPTEIARFKSALEDLHRASERLRADALREFAARVQALEPPAPAADVSRCLIVSRAHDATAASVTDDLPAGAKSLGWHASLVTCHRPGQTSTLALLAEIDRLKPHFILLLNEVRGQVGSVLPPTLPVVSWFLHPRHVSAMGQARPAAEDLLLAESPTTARRLLNAGIDPATIHVMPPCAAALEPAPESGSDTPARGRDWDVACFADAADLSPQAHGIELTTLAAIWNALVEAFRRLPEDADPDRLERLLDDVVQRIRIRLTDRQVRHDLLSRLEFDAADTVLTRHYLKTLMDSGVRVRIWGRGWQNDPALAKAWAGERPAPPGTAQILSQSPLVMDCCIRERLSRDMLTAALFGAVPLVRGRFPPRSGSSPGPVAWPQVYRPAHLGMVTYVRAGGLANAVRDLINKEETRAGTAENIRARVSQGHKPKHRLQAVAPLLAERTAG